MRNFPCGGSWALAEPVAWCDVSIAEGTHGPAAVAGLEVLAL